MPKRRATRTLPPLASDRATPPPEQRSTVVPHEWRDPSDIDSARARFAGARTVHGWRRTWTPAVLHAACPREIREEHVAAAERLLADFETGALLAVGRTLDMRVDISAGRGGFATDRLDALTRLRQARAALGTAGTDVVDAIVLANWTLAALARRLGIVSHRAHGRLYAALQRLHEHYHPAAGTGDEVDRREIRAGRFGAEAG